MAEDFERLIYDAYIQALLPSVIKYSYPFNNGIHLIIVWVIITNYAVIHLTNDTARGALAFLD